MNNIEVNELRKYVNLKSGLTDSEIIQAKNKIKQSENRFNKFVENNLLNLKKDLKDNRDFKFNRSTSLPSVDWEKEMSPVKDQGRLGSCVGFATVAMKEWQEQKEHLKEVEMGKKYRRKEKHYDLSESWVYWNCKKIDPWPNEEGTSIRCAMKVLNKIGVPCEEAYPYSDINKGNPESWAKMVSRWGLIDSYWRCNGLEELKSALVDGPVVIGILCFREIFFVGMNGFIPYPVNPNEVFGGHAVCATGFNDKNRTVTFKNSWSMDWGRKGYGVLPYDYIKDFMLDAWHCKDMKVNKRMFNKSMDNKLI